MKVTAEVTSTRPSETRDVEFTAYLLTRQSSLLRAAYLLTGDPGARSAAGPRPGCSAVRVLQHRVGHHHGRRHDLGERRRFVQRGHRPPHRKDDLADLRVRRSPSLSDGEPSWRARRTSTGWARVMPTCSMQRPANAWPPWSRPRLDGATAQQVWEDDEHALAVVRRQGQWYVERLGLDRTRETVLGPAHGPDPETASYVLS